MTEIQFASNLTLPGSPELSQKLIGLFTRCAAMGLLSTPTITRLDGAVIRQLVADLQRQGIALSAGVGLEELMRDRGAPLSDAALQALESLIDGIGETLESIAAPRAEWPAMRQALGDEALADLLEISLSSLRRYSTAERETPADVVNRLHWLALVVADLAGAYNDFGIRRWFERPRAQLGGVGPREFLGPGWHFDDERSQWVRQLARTISGASTLAV
jgi:hypothetical protein